MSVGRTLAITVASFGLATTLHFAVGSPRVAPQIRWTHDERPIEPFTDVEPLTTLRCELELDRESFVYAVSSDLTRGTIALFPSEQLRSDLPPNPWPAGRYALPGRHLDRDLHWHAGDAAGAIAFVVLVSDAPLTELESVLPRMQQMGNGAFPQRPVLGTYAPKIGIEHAPTRSAAPAAILRDALAIQRFDHDGALHELAEGVYASSLRLTVRSGADEAPLADRVRDQLHRDLGPLITPAAPK